MTKLKRKGNDMKKTLATMAAMAAMAAAVQAAPQTTCPVMKGVPVDEHSQYVDAEGYRIYVCCGACAADVAADSAKYVAELQAAGVELARAPGEEKAE